MTPLGNMKTVVLVSGAVPFPNISIGVCAHVHKANTSALLSPRLEFSF